MREVLGEMDRWQADGEAIALATLVGVRGSAPRALGARLVCTRSGKMVGSVSGGCVESDVVERAVRVLDSRRPEIARYEIADEWGVRVGLSCGGVIDVLIEPYAAAEAWQVVRTALAERYAVALCVGLAPAGLLGRKLAVFGDRDGVGSIDPALDQEVEASARLLLREGGARVVTRPWRGEEARVFVEAFSPPARLFIVGATHMGVALCRMAKALGFWVGVVDPRGAYATTERFPDADELILAPPAEVLGAAGLDESSYVVTLTHDVKFDVPSLAVVLRSGARYVGALGSRATHARRAAQLREQGLGDVDLARIHAPIGLDIGARTPEEIAVAILAEMLAVRSGKQGAPLAGRPAVTHADR